VELDASSSRLASDHVPLRPAGAEAKAATLIATVTETHADTIDHSPPARGWGACIGSFYLEPESTHAAIATLTSPTMTTLSRSPSRAGQAARISSTRSQPRSCTSANIQR
jgi:hypothetical protein